MPEHSLQILDKAVHDTETWLNDMIALIGGDKQQAYHALSAGMHALRDRVEINEAVDLGAQLPLLVSGIYYENWKPAKVPETPSTRQEYVDGVARRLADSPNADADAAASAVFTLLKRHCDPGELSNIASQLPGEVQEMFHNA